MSMKRLASAAVVAAFMAGGAHALVFNFDVTGINSNFEYGNPGNEVRNVNLGANAIVTGIGWDVNLTADPNFNSWLSEMAVELNDSTAANPDAVWLRPGAGVNSSGTQQFTSGIVNFTDVGLNNIQLGADGVLRMEFFETFVDNSGGPDGTWNSGTLQIQYEAVPEPATMLALAGGIGAIALRRRRASK